MSSTTIVVHVDSRATAEGTGMFDEDIDGIIPAACSASAWDAPQHMGS